jgi:thiol-disulfide isomerase/thioredoxin
MRSTFIILFSVFCCELVAAPVSVKGTADKVYAGKRVYFYEISDALSGHRKLLAKTTVAGDGSFTLNSDIGQPVSAVISIDRVNGALFLAPGVNYDITFPALPPTVAKTLSNTNTVDLIFNGIPPNDLNGMIGEFNFAFDKFVDENIAGVFDKGFKEKLRLFRLYNDSIFSNGGPFVKDYIGFTFADFHQNIETNRKKIYETYIMGKAIDIRNPACGAFLAGFFDREISRFDGLGRSKPLAGAISRGQGLAFRDTLTRNDFLKGNPLLLEAVALQSLAQVYPVSEYRENILSMIRQIGEASKYADIKMLAEDLYSELSGFEKGFPAPPFSLEDEQGNMKTLSYFAGKPTLITFWASWSKDAMAEMKLLNDLYGKYGQKVNFVYISADEDKNEFRKFMSANYNLKGIFLHAAGEPDILENYNVLFIPQFVLLDAKGNYLKAFAPLPSQDLEHWLSAAAK